MQIKHAGEIMIPLERFAFIPHWFSLKQAMVELSRSVSGCRDHERHPWMILVFSAQNQLLGFMRRAEIMHGLIPDALTRQPAPYREQLFEVSVDPNIAGMLTTNEEFLNRLRRQLDRPVSELMVPVGVTVDHSDSIFVALSLMQSRDLSFLPVVRDRQVVGLIDAVDLVNEIVSFLV